MNNYEEGGLKLPHIESYWYALKMSWIQKLLNPMNHSQWKLLLLDKIEKIRGDKVWLLQKVGIQKISTKFNPFWRDIFLNWSTIFHEFNTDLTFLNFVWKLLITLFGQPRSNSIPKTLNFPE
jgi:hypothetical protein